MTHRFCHLQIHTVHVQIFHYRRSKCPPCTVTRLHVMLPFSGQILARAYKASYDTSLYEVFALLSTEHVFKIWHFFRNILYHVISFIFINEK